MAVILDNAAYHHGMPDDWNSPLKANKTDNAASLRALGVLTINVIPETGPNNNNVPAEGESLGRAPRGRSAQNVQEAIHRRMEEVGPDFLTREEICPRSIILVISTLSSFHQTSSLSSSSRLPLGVTLQVHGQDSKHI